jgi:hypothetical protein
VWFYVNTVVPVPIHNPIALDLHEVKEARAHRILLDGVKDHLIPHLAEKKTTKEMWDALTKLYRVTTRIERWLSGTNYMPPRWQGVKV